MIIKRKLFAAADKKDIKKRAKDLIKEYEKRSGMAEDKDFDDIEVFDEDDILPPSGFTDYSFQAKKGSKLQNKYGPDFFWTIRRNNKTGECEFLEAGD